VTRALIALSSRASAIAQKTFGADRSPKGKTESMYVLHSHIMPKRCLSVGWTGTFLYAWAMSIFANSVPGPNSDTVLAASSIIDAYCIVR
jgi:hypothetical protein